MRNTKNEKFNRKERKVFYTKILAIDVAKGKIMVTLISSFNRFNNIKELTVYCGLNPSIRQSGKTVNVQSKSRNKYLRKILYMIILNIL